MSYRILHVDDHPLIMVGTKMVLEREGDFEVTICDPHDDVVSVAINGNFDVMLFDYNMPGLNGIELSRRVLEQMPEAMILIYSGFDLTSRLGQLISLGVAGFVSKGSSVSRLIQAIRCILNGETIIPLSMLRALSHDADFGHTAAVAPVTLSDRDVKILREVAMGKSNKQIAEMMHVSQRSLEYTLTQLFHKLSVHTRVEAVNKARTLGLLLDEDFSTILR
jgi:two-component system competent response regulator ComA